MSAGSMALREAEASRTVSVKADFSGRLKTERDEKSGIGRLLGGCDSDLDICFNFNLRGGTNGVVFICPRRLVGRGGGGEVRRLGRVEDEFMVFPRGRYSVVTEIRGLDDLIVVRSLGSLGFL